MGDRRSKDLLKTTFIYAIGNIGAKFLRFLLIPVYTFFLTKDELGLYDLLLTTVLLLEPLLTLKVTESTFRWLLDKKANDRLVVSTTFIFILGTTFFGISALYGFHFFVQQVPYVNIFSILLVFKIISNFLSEVARGLGKEWHYAVYGIVLTATSFIFAILALYFSEDKLYGLLLSSVFSLGISSLGFYLVSLQNLFGLEFSFEQLRSYLKYSSPLVPSSINWWGIKLLNRFVISSKMGLNWNGIFAVSYTFPQISIILGQIFYLAWQKSSIEEYNSKDRDQYFSELFSKYVNFQFSLAFFLMAVSRILFLFLFEDSYKEAYTYSYPLLLGAVFNSFGAFYAVGYLGARKTVGAFATSFVGVVINVLILFLFTDRYGLWAASLANLFGFIGLWVSRIFDSKKYSVVRVPWFKTILFTLLFSLIGTLIVICSGNIIYAGVLECLSGIIALYLSKNFLLSIFQKLKSKINKPYGNIS